MSRFGTLIRKLRKERGLTLDHVAKKIGSHKGYVSGIENGKVNPPSVKFLRKFAKIFRYDEREMVRMAYVDKAPRLIREEIQALVYGGGGTSALLPLLNTVETGYTRRLDAQGRLEPEEGVRAGQVGPLYAATVTDDSMENAGGFSLSRGDVVLLSPAGKIESGGVYYVVYSSKESQQAVVRQVFLDENRNYVLQPSQKDRPLEFLPQDDVDALFVVVGWVHARGVAPEGRRAVPSSAGTRESKETG